MGAGSGKEVCHGVGGPTSVQCKTVISNNQSNPPPKEWTVWSEGVPASEVPDRASCEYSISGSKAEWKEILKKKKKMKYQEAGERPVHQILNHSRQLFVVILNSQAGLTS